MLRRGFSPRKAGARTGGAVGVCTYKKHARAKYTRAPRARARTRARACRRHAHGRASTWQSRCRPGA
eukprot:11170446-Lingulodinium_polyedra.AAC.1